VTFGLALGAFVVGLWVLQGAGLGEFVDHTGSRLARDWTWGEFAERQWRFARGLLPWWYLVLALPAFVAGLWDDRTRYLTGALSLMVVVFAVVPADNAWRHDYWNFPVLMALFPGFVALFSLFGDWLGRWTGFFTGRMVEVGVAVAVLSMLFAVSADEIHEEYFETPSMAGDLIAAVEPPVGQAVAWHVPQVPWPTWISYAWGLPPAAVSSAEDLAGVPDDDLVVVRLDHLPDFLEGDVAGHVVEVVGDYGVVTGAVLARHVVG
jgi:hypothetical protein